MTSSYRKVGCQETGQVVVVVTVVPPGAVVVVVTGTHRNLHGAYEHGASVVVVVVDVVVFVVVVAVVVVVVVVVVVFLHPPKGKTRHTGCPSLFKSDCHKHCPEHTGLTRGFDGGDAVVVVVVDVDAAGADGRSFVQYPFLCRHT
jgi:hypothetical protein